MIDLATWNLSIPEGSPPATIETPRLAQGFKDQYFSSEAATAFLLGTCDRFQNGQRYLSAQRVAGNL